MAYCRIVDRFLALGPSDEAVLKNFDELLSYFAKNHGTLVHQLSNIRARDPGHDLNHLGADILGVGYTVVLENSTGAQLMVGVAEHYWLLRELNPSRGLFRSPVECGWICVIFHTGLDGVQDSRTCAKKRR